MFLLEWYREYLSIKSEREVRAKELSFCESCETLKMQLAVANDERKMLIAKLTDKPEVEDNKIDTSNLRPILPSRMNWNVRQQMLEKEDRAAAKALREKQAELTKSGKALTISEIEKELGVTENG
jgi:hypothetical protein